MWAPKQDFHYLLFFAIIFPTPQKHYWYPHLFGKVDSSAGVEVTSESPDQFDSELRFRLGTS